MSQLVRSRRHVSPTCQRLSILDLFVVWRQRRHLHRLDDRLLDDIGLSRSDAEAEAQRPFWDAPGTWRA